MTIRYLQLQPGLGLPKFFELGPFRSVIIIEDNVTPEWRSRVSAWLVESGCLFMMAWGEDCSSWDDSVDFANLEAFDYKKIPEDQFVMTTWHENESLQEVFWFSKNSAVHHAVELNNTLLLHISNRNKEKEFLAEYESACKLD